MNLRYFTSALTLEQDSSRCVGCGRCVDVCPHNVFALMRSPNLAGPAGEKRPRLRSSIIARDRCMECGACARNCAAGAITVTAGVGCAAAIINGLVHNTAPTCGCGDDGESGSGGCCCGGGSKPDCGCN
jgi:ferredoxin